MLAAGVAFAGALLSLYALWAAARLGNEPLVLPMHDRAGEDSEGLARAVASQPDISLVTLDEIFANVQAVGLGSHGVNFRLELELFDESGRSLVDSHASGVKDVILQASLEQNYARLNTLPGKLYFKEILASRINEYLQQPVIREVHFASFFLH
jgi:flagellar basal body-associated protein FliL